MEDVEHVRNGDTYCNWCTRNDPQRLAKGSRRLKVGGRIESIQKKSIVEIGQNTEKSSSDLRRFAVSQTQVRPSVDAGEKNSQGLKARGGRKGNPLGIVQEIYI